jgi:hypothetical protein
MNVARERVIEAEGAQPALVRLRPRAPTEALPPSQQELRQAVTRAHQVLARVIDAAHQITETLVHLARHERKAKLAGREQPHQPLGITPISLHPVTRRPRDRARRHDPDIQAALLGHASQREPRRARLIHSRHRAIQLLQEHRHHTRRLATQPLHMQLAGRRIEQRGNRLRLVNIKPDKGHTL